VSRTLLFICAVIIISSRIDLTRPHIRPCAPPLPRRNAAIASRIPTRWRRA
jgi:hypothetical protein